MIPAALLVVVGIISLPVVVPVLFSEAYTPMILNIKITCLSPMETFMQLVSYTFKLDIVDKLMLRKEFHSLSRVAALPLFYRLTFPHDFSLLPDVRQAVLDHLKEA